MHEETDLVAPISSKKFINDAVGPRVNSQITCVLIGSFLLSFPYALMVMTLILAR